MDRPLTTSFWVTRIVVRASPDRSSPRTGPTPNDTYAGDVLVSNLTHALNGIVTNPLGNGWYDRYGLENTDKCVDELGQPSFGANLHDCEWGASEHQTWVLETFSSSKIG